MKLKSPRFRSRAYLAHVASLPCCVCGINPGGVAHQPHRGSNHGMILKASDDQSIPLCNPCHNALHRDGNEVRWLAECRIDGPELARTIFDRWRMK